MDDLGAGADQYRRPMRDFDKTLISITNTFPSRVFQSSRPQHSGLY